MYTIHNVAKKMNMNPHTVRYYAKEGLFPFVQRNSNGIRQFQECDLEWLSLIHCLKNSGMTLKEIKQFIQWINEGDSTVEQRLNLFKKQQQKVEHQLQELQKTLETIKYKRKFYEDMKKSLDL
ncbi:MerR family transcriptional regulator [Commensalibacter papalotli (ex Botero et al. 2024)]|uniref:MerR family (SoxR) (PDB:2VZ4) n=1 Tax=Commensalibacter papalotli (ex Botero et al. 2024) TaxID=2972766 RepID=A0ABN8WBP6_9PROT|nr:MerR family transcriptional regulator [Commensalibacter papalotli (ex Botero et al. 2024)]CAI3931019.1 DNA-binding transcriptional regulator [Commensalibacter papalotli (ex Botero et al. 2024)]CAI3944654.1 DNA-binding transcriptional regulator [Commensalibacter papalotli (ex Botero et al. 2024)]